MKVTDSQRFIRSRPPKTTTPDKKRPCPLDKVNRQFRASAPNMLWVSDFTDAATWNGVVHVALVTDAYARRTVALRDLHANPIWLTAWRVSTSPHAGFILHTL